MTMMSGGGEFQSNVAWRFHHNPKRDWTAFREQGIHRSRCSRPAGQLRNVSRHSFRTRGKRLAWAATGMASRSSYVWVGGGFMHFGEREADRRPNVISTSVVYRYRPPSWRSDRHQWDWRIFAEMTGEHVGPMQRSGVVMPGSNANQVFLGLTVLGIYKSFGISGGAQFPIYRDVGSAFPKERVRIAINVSYFLFHHSH
jgi:hypothetical protein